MSITALSLALGTAHAAEYNVEPTTDIVNLLSGLNAGDVVTFAPGEYEITQTLSISAAGTEAAPVLLRGAEKAEDGTGGTIITLRGGGSIVDIRDSTWLDIQDITFQGDPASNKHGYEGLRIDNYKTGNQNITIRDCVIRRTRGTGISVRGTSSGITIEHNEVTQTNGGSGITIGCGGAECAVDDSFVVGNWVHSTRNPDGDSWETGIYVGVLSTNNLIKDNVVHDVQYRGISVATQQGGDSNEVDGNAVWNVGKRSDGKSHGVDGDGMFVGGNAIVRNNVIFEVVGYGLRSYSENDTEPYDAIISHNTIVDTTNTAVRLDDWAGQPGNVFANNAVANGLGTAIYLDDDAIDDQNFIQNNVVTGAVYVSDKFDLETMVQNLQFIPGGGFTDFVDVATWDFYPIDSSSLINAGDATGKANVPELDFNGLPREGDLPDAGALEWQPEFGDANPGWIITEGFKDVEDAGDVTYGTGGCCSKGDEASLVFVPGLLGLGLARRRRSR